MDVSEFIQKMEEWDIDESRFCGGVTFYKEGDDQFVFSAFQHGWLPIYLNKDELIRFTKGELDINDLGF